LSFCPKRRSWPHPDWRLSQLGNYAADPSTHNIDYQTWSDDLTYTRGKHLLKTGALIEHAYTDKADERPTVAALYTFANMAQFLAGVPSRFQGNTPDSNFHRQRPTRSSASTSRTTTASRRR